jgi:glutaredoxin
MEHLAKLLDADVARYSDGKDRSGALGYVGACVASLKKTFPKVTVEGKVSLADYDRVLIGMPVWVEGPCVVGKALIEQYKNSLPQEVYYVVTQMGGCDYSSKIKKLDDLLGRPSAGQISLKTKEHDFRKDAEEFAKTLKAE